MGTTFFATATTMTAGLTFFAVPTRSEASPVDPWCTDISGFDSGGTNCYFSTYD